MAGATWTKTRISPSIRRGRRVLAMMDLSAILWLTGIGAFFVVCIWLLIRTSFQIERRDRRLGRRDLDEGGNIFDPNDGPQ